MGTVIGIDIGGSTTKIVGFRKTEGGAPELIAPQFVRAHDLIRIINDSLSHVREYVLK